MKAIRTVIGLALFIGIAIPGSPTIAQTTSPKEPQPQSLGSQKLTGADAKRAEELDKAVATALKADRWDDAIKKAEELLALRTRAQGPKHFETVNAEWRLKTLRQVAPMPDAARVAYQSARTMIEQAKTLRDQGKYGQAQPLFEKALEINRRLLTDGHPDTAKSYNELAYNLNMLGKHKQAQPLKEKALEIRRRLLTDDHPDTAESYNDLGYNLSAQGKYALARPLYEKALAIRRRLLTDDHVDTAGSYNNVASNLKAQGKYAQAQPLYEKALEIYRRLLTDDHTDTARSYNNLAGNLKDQGKYAQAQPLYEKALEIRRRLLTDDHPDTANSYNNLAANLYSQGKHAEAQSLYEKALEIWRRLLGDDHPLTATGYSNVAINLKDQGKYAQAQPLFKKALEIRRRVLGDDHPDTARAYSNLAGNLEAQGNYAQAQPLQEKALEIRRRLLTDDHPDTASGYNSLAVNLAAQGGYARAQPLFEKALEIRRRLLTDDHPRTALSYNNLANNLVDQGKYAQAQPLHEQALKIKRRVLGDDHPETSRSFYNLALDLHAQGKYPEARDQWLLAVKSLDKARLRVAFTGLERAGGAKLPTRSALAAVLARLGQPAEAWQSLEEDLGRGLLDELAARQDRRLAPAERTRLRELTAALDRLDRLVEIVPQRLDNTDRAKRLADLEAQRALAGIALGEFQAQLEREHGALAGQVAGLNEIQATLPADAAFVAWVDIKAWGPTPADPNGEHWGVIVRSRGVPIWVPLVGTGRKGRWTPDDTAFTYRVLEALWSPPGAGSAELRSLVEKLCTQRLDPLAKALGTTADGLPPARRLIVLPSLAMAGIPVDVLLAADDTRTVSYAPSATVFKYLREQPRPDRHAGLLALGDPLCSPPLPGTRHEVKALARLFQSDDRPTRALLGADANAAELDRLAASGELGRFGFIHLAAHGSIDGVMPQRSAVILTQSQLSVREIQRNWDLRAELVTLSACETALGRHAGGEGFVGFTQALLMSGARSVCLSLWRVEDTATALLMKRFYGNVLGRRAGLERPMPKAEALREAKAWLRGLRRPEVLALIEELTGKVDRGKGTKARQSAELAAGDDNDRPFEAPQYWAAFVLAGDPD